MRPRPIALVTGASAGIGRELCRILAGDGHDLVLVARRRDRLEALAAELEGATCHVVPADLSDPASPRAVAQAVEELGLGIDLLVNNAGFGSTGAFHTLPLDRELDMVQVNVSALVALTGLLLPQMVERGRGAVLNIASTAGFQPGPFMATYFATKAFVLSWSEALAWELRGSGVTVTAHCPGATSSEFGDVSGNGKNKLFTQTTPATAAEVAAHALGAARAGRPIAVHGLTNAIGAFGVRLSPRSLVKWLAASLNQE